MYITDLAISLSSPLYPGQSSVHEKKAERGLQQRRDYVGKKKKKKKTAMRSSSNINSEVDQKANIRRLMQFRNGGK